MVRRRVHNDRAGLDAVEYTLLLAFVTLASLSMFMGSGQTVSGLWSTVHSSLVQAKTAVISAVYKWSY
jgi:Flp pilus assembly pilin Flp